MSRRTLWIPLAASLFLASELPACGPPDARHYPRPLGGGVADAGTATGTGGMEPEPTATGGNGTGGSAGRGTGGAMETGGAGGGGSAGTGGAEVADAAVGTGGAGGTLEPDDASTPDLPGTGGATGGMGGADAGPATGGQGGRDAGPLPGSANMAYCHPDPNVIEICKQLEPACLNCPSNSTRCFNVAQAGDDRACARYAVDNGCKVDVGGNWCGSLNCMAQGCDRAACTTAQGEGASADCQKLLAKCPCK
jgi:hypothetical protein